MITLVLGGSGSGKSEFAEALLLETDSKNKYYIATMKVYGEEGQKKVDRHRRLREGKGFSTIESPTDLTCSIGEIKTSPENKASGMLECMSNLLANEMFQKNNIILKEIVVEKIIRDIIDISHFFEHLIIVSNNVFEDGVEYEDSTHEYIKALGLINQEIAKISTQVFEVVVGIPIKQKG